MHAQWKPDLVLLDVMLPKLSRTDVLSAIRRSSNMTLPRFHVTMRLKRRSDTEGATVPRKVDPQLILSEGQLAANGFSILCSASVSYPWSRWRALLLDDPLQHNDVIHAAAFTDVMRNFG